MQVKAGSANSLLVSCGLEMGEGKGRGWNELVVLLGRGLAVFRDVLSFTVCRETLRVVNNREVTTSLPHF